MPLYYKLNKQLDGGKLLQDIQKLITSTNNKEGILYIDIRTVSYEDNGPIPKLEYKKTPEQKPQG